MNNDKLICIRDEDDNKLTTLLSDGWKIIQISASGIYCWVLLRKPNNTKKKIKGWHFKEWVCPNCKHLNYTYDEED